MTMISFQPDLVDADPNGHIETALFIGVRGEPSLESTQLRWQVRVGTHDIVQLASGATYLEKLGGALFITTKEPRPESGPDATPDPIGWMRWIAEDGRRSFQIQLAISRVGFDRVCLRAEQGHFPDAMLTFKDDGRIERVPSPGDNKKLWNNVESKIALLSEFTLRYDFALLRSSTALPAIVNPPT
jgi:hypothetical protein